MEPGDLQVPDLEELRAEVVLVGLGPMGENRKLEEQRDRLHNLLSRLIVLLESSTNADILEVVKCGLPEHDDRHCMVCDYRADGVDLYQQYLLNLLRGEKDASNEC